MTRRAPSAIVTSHPAFYGDGAIDALDPVLSPSVQESKRTTAQKATLLAPVIVVTVLLLAGCGSGGPSDQSNAIETQIGGGIVCSLSSYQLINRLDNSKTPLYVCQTLGHKPICVTDENNIVSNVTGEVRLLFSNTLGSSKPGCIT